MSRYSPAISLPEQLSALEICHVVVKLSIALLAPLTIALNVFPTQPQTFEFLQHVKWYGRSFNNKEDESKVVNPIFAERERIREFCCTREEAFRPR